jgi:hypothetical protein
MTRWVIFHPYPDDVGNARYLAVGQVKSRREGGGVTVAYGLNPVHRLSAKQVVGEYSSEGMADDERDRLRAALTGEAS